MASEEEVRKIKRRHAPQLLSQPGVCGVGVEKDEHGEYVLVIHLDTHDPEARKRLPKQIEGHPVKFIQSGPFRKLSS
jgi:hypothetical protein